MRQTPFPSLDGSDGFGASGRCAAAPDMADREERGQRLVENDEMDIGREGQHRKKSGALHELSGMRDFLTERTIRRIFVDRISVAMDASRTNVARRMARFG